MNAGIGAARTVPEHREWADQLYASYARGREARLMAAIVGESGPRRRGPRRARLRGALRAASSWGRADGAAAIAETIAVGWRLLESLPREDLVRVRDATWAARAEAAPSR